MRMAYNSIQFMVYKVSILEVVLRVFYKTDIAGERIFCRCKD